MSKIVLEFVEIKMVNNGINFRVWVQQIWIWLVIVINILMADLVRSMIKLEATLINFISVIKHIKVDIVLIIS